MQISEIKSRMIRFRLSSPEYEDLEQACHARGYPSVSLLARAAVMAYRDSDAAALQEVAALVSRIDALKAEIDYLGCLALCSGSGRIKGIA